ncbi:MAG: hypothetical protein V5A23_07680 [Halobacteriales archaeon]
MTGFTSRLVARLLGRSPRLLAAMAGVLAIYSWVTIDLPLLPKAGVVLASVVVFLAVVAAIEWLTDRGKGGADAE